MLFAGYEFIQKPHTQIFFKIITFNFLMIPLGAFSLRPTFIIGKLKKDQF